MLSHKFNKIEDLKVQLVTSVRLMVQTDHNILMGAADNARASVMTPLV